MLPTILSLTTTLGLVIEYASKAPRSTTTSTIRTFLFFSMALWSFRARGRGFRGFRQRLRVAPVQPLQHDFHAPVARAARGGRVAVDRALVGVAGGAQARGVDALADEEAHDHAGARGGELPVAGEARAGDGHVVGVAFHRHRGLAVEGDGG